MQSPLRSAPRRAALSAGQQGLWFAARLDDRAGAAYDMLFAFEADGEIDIALLERALDVLQDRHEILRAQVQADDGVPRFVIHPVGAAPRIRATPAAGPLQRAAQAETGRPITLDQAPLLRVVHVLSAPGGGPSGLLFKIPHLVFDGPSSDRFFAELGDVARRLADGQMPPPGSDDGTSDAFVRSEAAWLHGMEGRAAIEAVHRRIAGVAPPLDVARSRASSQSLSQPQSQSQSQSLSQSLSLSQSYPESLSLSQSLSQSQSQSLSPSPMPLPSQLPSHALSPSRSPMPMPHVGEARLLEFPIEAEGSARIAAFARSRRTTPAAVWLAAFEVALWQCTGRADFLVTLPVTQHDRADNDTVLGYFTNLGIARARVDATLTGADFVDRVADDLLEALEARAVPFKTIASRHRGAARGPRTAFSQFGFNFERLAGGQSFRLGSRSLRACEMPPRWAKEELKLDVLERPEGARGWLVADRTAFDDAALEAIAGALFEFLEALLEDAQSPLARLHARVAA